MGDRQYLSVSVYAITEYKAPYSTKINVARSVILHTLVALLHSLRRAPAPLSQSRRRVGIYIYTEWHKWQTTSEHEVQVLKF